MRAHLDTAHKSAIAVLEWQILVESRSLADIDA
jgi:hypothetical protein